ncbi:MAG: hypothetical protein MJ002_05460 [Paludibacteraceae bacterium]|nr:hypothetical protein [Paludibacteraceae bacterium]
MKTTKKIVRYSKFISNPFGDGGSKRSAQIEELWHTNDIDFFEEKFILPKNYSKFHAAVWVIRAINFITNYVGWNHYSSLWNKINAILLFALRIPIVYDKYKGKEVIFVWEHTQDYAVMYLMKAVGAKIIAYPHNLESLVPTQSDPLSKKQSPYWLYEEIERLKMCDEVYCISKEETWLLSLYGVNAFYFPYSPPAEVKASLEIIKEYRQKRNTEFHINNYLILGSATNPPTRSGMEHLIEELVCDKMVFEIHVAGYGTENMIRIEHPNIVYHGSLNQEDMCKLLIETDGLIINQPPTSGALTRIAEMRIAGVPVYVNFAAARDYYNLEGLFVYDTFDQLRSIL